MKDLPLSKMRSNTELLTVVEQWRAKSTNLWDHLVLGVARVGGAGGLMLAFVPLVIPVEYVDRVFWGVMVGLVGLATAVVCQEIKKFSAVAENAKRAVENNDWQHVDVHSIWEAPRQWAVLSQDEVVALDKDIASQCCPQLRQHWDAMLLSGKPVRWADRSNILAYKGDQHIDDISNSYVALITQRDEHNGVAVVSSLRAAEEKTDRGGGRTPTQYT